MKKVELTQSELTELSNAKGRYDYLHDLYIDNDREHFPNLLARFEKSPSSEQEMLRLWCDFSEQ